jgi:hypothetical protein
VGEREHESPRFVSNIDIPPDLETVQRFEDAAQGQEDKKRPPAEAQIAIRIVHDG